MAKGAYEVHSYLKSELENYIKSQFFGKSPLLLSAISSRLDEEGVLYQQPYIESSPAYVTVEHGLQAANIPAWMRSFFEKLADANLGVYTSPFKHQIDALETAVQGKDLFVATGTGSGKTECFMWPILAKLTQEAKESPTSWSQRGVRVLIMYPMNALVSDQIGRLRRLIGDPNHKFVQIFRETAGNNARRPQFGMYTGRTPYPGNTTFSGTDKELAKTLSRMTKPDTEDQEKFYQTLLKEGRIPAKEDMASFIDDLRESRHIPNSEDAELITRFEMQGCCPDILITNYSMLEYMLFRPREKKIWDDTKKWLDSAPENKLLFVIDEAHMYRGSSGGEVALLIRRLFHRLGIGRDRVQFILTTASMPNKTDEDRMAVHEFAQALTGADNYTFTYLTGERETIAAGQGTDIPFIKFKQVTPEEIEADGDQKVAALNRFWSGLPGAPTPFASLEDVSYWLYDHLVDYVPFQLLLKECRGNAESLHDFAKTIFPAQDNQEALNAVSVLLAIAPLAKNKKGMVLCPTRMHMLFRGVNGVYACTNPQCPHSHTDGKITLGDIFLSDAEDTCPTCHSTVYELYNDRKCGALFIKGYVLKSEMDSYGRAYLWRYSGQVIDTSTLKEIHLYIPEKGFVPQNRGKYPLRPCYLDSRSGFINFRDDSMAGKDGVLKLYYANYSEKGHPDTITFPTCPHCKRRMLGSELTSFATRGNLSFYNLIKAQFDVQPPVKGKENNPRLPNAGRKVLLFSDSRQRAARLARDMSNASDMTAARQLAVLAIARMQKVTEEQSLNDIYGFFVLEAALHQVQLYSGDDRNKFVVNDCAKILRDYKRRQRAGRPWHPSLTIGDNAPDQMKEQLLRMFCGAYDTLTSVALCWLSPTDEAMFDAVDELAEEGQEVSEEEFLEVFNAWIDDCCDEVALGQTISNDIRSNVRKGYGESGYGLSEDWTMPATICKKMGWEKKGETQSIWKRILQRRFLEKGDFSKWYIDLTKVKPCFDLNHKWYRCPKCSTVTPYTLKGGCPNCGADIDHPMTEEELHALDFWRVPAISAISDNPIYVIDTEEHTAQLSYKDQSNDMWSKTEQYELRFQDMVRKDESPVDILSSTTTMEVGIDIGSLVAVGLRNIPPMRENYQQRAGRAGRRGASLSTIVTYCDNGPHDTYYFQNPEPMLQGDPRRPWIDISSEKLIQRHLSMVALQEFLKQEASSLELMGAAEFVDEKLEAFQSFLRSFQMVDRFLIPASYHGSCQFKETLIDELQKLKLKKEAHPELYQVPDGVTTKSKSLLDALYEEGIIPTYSFPKNVVSTYISNQEGKQLYQVERGLDIAIGEYAPGRAIVVDKATYQIGGFYYPGSERRKGCLLSPAKAFVDDENYCKEVVECQDCGWFGLKEDHMKACPFCGSQNIMETKPMLRPWGFAPKDGRAIPEVLLEEERTVVQQPLYSTLPESETMAEIAGCKNVRMASRTNQRIIMINKGIEGKGFTVCCDCGAAMPGDGVDTLNEVNRPYISKYIRSNRCRHTNTKQVNLGYDFITDMLVLEIYIDPQQVETERKDNLWLARAGTSLAEAIRLVISRIMDIEFTELMTGYRVRRKGQDVFLDVYIYDNLSSGAGYAVGVASIMPEVLHQVDTMLSNCTCKSACRDCLKHYRNQNLHGLLDRHAALELLHWAKDGTRPTMAPIADQVQMLIPLKEILEKTGIRVSVRDDKIILQLGNSVKELRVYPAMWKKPEEPECIFVSDSCLKYAKPYAIQQITNFL